MTETCEQCSNPLDAAGNCQYCLLQLGISHGQNIPNEQLAILPSLAELNRQFPQLDIKRLIGRGGMGAIYHARQTTLDRDVALKLISKEVADDTAFIERFEREAKTLAKLTHPNIVTIFDFGRTDDGLAYLVMEYVDGINLREAISAGSVGPEDALDVVSTICRALEYAHSKGVVHRDIKPENILLGEDGTLKVADFGIAKIIDDSVRTPTLTATRQVLGSLHYLAPEHLESPDQVDHRVDLYALGVVFYELLTGQLPLGRYEPPSALFDRLDHRIDQIVLKTLNRKPAHRYQSASDLQLDIGQIQSGYAAQESPIVTPVDGRAIAVPFTCEAMGGFAEAVGMLHVSEDTMQAEFRIRDAFWGNVKSKTHIVDIPLSRLTSVELIPGIFSSKIVLIADKISTFDSLPNAETGRVEIKIKRSDYDLAADVVNAAGFSAHGAGGKRYPVSAAASPHPVPVSMDDTDSSRWTTLAILTLFTGILNAGTLGVTEFIIADEVRQDLEFVAASTMAAVTMGPVAFLQIITGLASLAFRPRNLAKATSVVSMIPVSPVWLLSFPVGLWAFKWLRDVPSRRSLAGTEADKKGWGATTMMYIRESRWSKTVALANIAGIVVLVAGLVFYKKGAFPDTLEFRVVDTEVDKASLEIAIEKRLQSLGDPQLGASRNGYTATWNVLSVSTQAKHRTQVIEELMVASPVTIAWLAADDVAQENSSTPEAKPEVSDEEEVADVRTLSTDISSSPTYSIALGLELDDEFKRSSSALGDEVSAQGTPLVLESSLVRGVSVGTPIRPNDSSAGRSARLVNTLKVELTARGREQLTTAYDDPRESAGIGLIVDGVLVGFASQDRISGNQLIFQLASESGLSPTAIIAAVRGPAIPSDLEFLD